MMFSRQTLAAGSLAAVSAIKVVTEVANATGTGASLAANAYEPFTPVENFDTAAYLGLWRQAYATQGLPGSAGPCTSAVYGAVEGRDDAITVLNGRAGLVPNGIGFPGFATAEFPGSANLQVNLGYDVTEPGEFVKGNYVIFDLGPKNEDGLYSWSALETNAEVPRLYLLARDLDEFAKVEEEVKENMRTKYGFYFDDEEPNPDFPGMLPVLTSNNNNCLVDQNEE